MSVTGTEQELVSWSVVLSPTGFYLFDLPTSPETKRLSGGFEKITTLLRSSPERCFFFFPPCVCTMIFFSLTWLTTSALTQSQGILGFVDHPGNSLLCTPGTVLQREGRMFITVGSPAPPALNLLSSPTSCLYITLPSPCAHPRPDAFPLFIVCQSRTDLATESVVCHTKCFLCPFCDQSRDSVV